MVSSHPHPPPLPPLFCSPLAQLPPETRSKQARLFNEPDTGFDILVASDAIGMGLNLNIRRIIFHTAVKPGYGKKNTAPQYMEASELHCDLCCVVLCIV